MSEPKHTPGPWEALTVADLCTGEEYAEDHYFEANAHLIAAAPTMLEALKLAESTFIHIKANAKMLEWASGTERAVWSASLDNVCDEVSKAIALAKGEQS